MNAYAEYVSEWIAYTTSLPPPSTLSILLSTGIVVITAISYISKQVHLDQDQKMRKHYLQSLFKGIQTKIKAAKQDANKLTKEQIKPLLQLQFTPDSVPDPSTIRQFKYAMELIQQHLEKLDNIRPNQVLIEYLARYPVNESSHTDQEKSPTDPEPHDRLLTRICGPFSESDRSDLMTQFHDLKAMRKSLVQHLLASMNQLDQVMEHVDSS